MLTIRCSEHPRYQAINKPAVNCQSCENLYNLEGFVKKTKIPKIEETNILSAYIKILRDKKRSK